MSNTRGTRKGWQYAEAVQESFLTGRDKAEREDMLKQARLSKAAIKKLYPDGRTRRAT